MWITSSVPNPHLLLGILFLLQLINRDGNDMAKQHLDILVQDDLKYDIRIENAEINRYLHDILRD